MATEDLLVAAGASSSDLVAEGASSSDRRQWRRIFESLVEMLQARDAQIESLVADRSYLQDYIHAQHDRWVSRTQYLESNISNTKKQSEMWKKVQAAKLDSLLGLKERVALCYKEQYDEAKKELEDFRECFEALNHQITELKINDKEKESTEAPKAAENRKGEEQQHAMILQGELKKIKHAYKKLIAKKEAEVSSLLSEKDFIWNQFKIVDNECTNLRKSKHTEIEQANEAVENLQRAIQELQSSESEKNETILKLRSGISKLETDLKKCSTDCELANVKLLKLQDDMEELRKLSNEKDVIIQKLRNGQANNGVDRSRHINQKSRILKENGLSCHSAPIAIKNVKIAFAKRDAENVKIEVEQKRFRFNMSNGFQGSGTPNGLKRCSKAKATPTSPPESPKLFSSNFKVPKLKIISSS